ncbi:MAG: hypothetical protein ABTQ29_11065, partial [Siculibacillus sp.]
MPDHTWDDTPVRRPPPPGSLPIRLVETAMRNPVTSGGVFLSMVMIGVIAANALANQPARHPHPWFATRATADAARATQPAAAVPPQAQPTTAPNVLPRPRPTSFYEQPQAVQDLQT